MSGGAGLAGAFGAGHPLEPPELEALLEAGFWGVLTALGDGQPYGVPVIYGYDGEAFYILMLPGRKADLIDRNPLVALTIVEHDATTGGWRSAVVTARAEWLENLRGRIRGVDIVRRQMTGRRAPSVRDAARLARARIARLVPLEVTGRAGALW